MARDVHDIITEAVMQEGSMDKEEAAIYIKKLQSRGRYLQDVWSRLGKSSYGTRFCKYTTLEYLYIFHMYLLIANCRFEMHLYLYGIRTYNVCTKQLDITYQMSDPNA